MPPPGTKSAPDHEISYWGQLTIRCSCGWQHIAEYLAGDTINERLDRHAAHLASVTQSRKEKP